jgi:Alpha/beta hydrolase of unknown function (DUF1400)
MFGVKVAASIIAAGIGIVLSAIPAIAAERVVLRYSVLEASIPVADLRTLADTGEASSSLRNYLRQANTEPEELRRILTEEVDVDSVRISRILNSYPGELLLDAASEVIQTPSQRASRQSLRGAIVTSAVDDDNIRIIEILENYPTNEVYVDGNRLVELYDTIDGVVGQVAEIERIIDRL